MTAEDRGNTTAEQEANYMSTNARFLAVDAPNWVITGSCHWEDGRNGMEWGGN